MLSFEKVDLRQILWNLLTVFQGSIPTKLLTKKQKYNDILKETTAFIGNIDYARLRDYRIANFIKYEITSTSFYLTKDGFLHKH